MAKKKDIKVSFGVLHVRTTDNNTIVTLTTDKGDKLLGGGTGLLWYKGAKQNTPFAAEMLTKHVLKEAEGLGLKEIAVVVRWTGMGRDGVFKGINETGTVQIMSIEERTPIKFGGVKGYRPKKM
jgi:small subunit ribosomal protein S11